MRAGLGRPGARPVEFKEHTMLSIKNLSAGYGKVQVLHGISIDVPKGQVVTLKIGRAHV